MLPDRKKAKEVIEDLQGRFLDGDKLTIEEIMKEYFSTSNAFNYLVIKGKIRSWLSNIKRHFRNTEGLWFGSLDENGHYGLITSIEEATFAMIRYYKFVKGNIASANFLSKDAEQKGILPKGLVRERMLVARIKEEKDEK